MTTASTAMTTAETAIPPSIGRQLSGDGRNRPKLLFLAWYFPPVQAIASVRTWNIARHLSRRGWEVTVVTPDPALHRHLESPEQARAEMASEGIRQILTPHRLRCLDPYQLKCRNHGLYWFAGGVCRNVAMRLGIDAGAGWIRAAQQACAHLSANDVDLILASGPPFSSFVLAERLSRQMNRPYVVDYRDPWTMLPNVRPAVQSWIVRLENRILSGAAGVTTVSPCKSMELAARFKVGSKLRIVTNGFDAEELAAVQPHSFGHSAIVYAGHIWPPERVITPVLAALRRVAANDPHCDWNFHYYGEHSEHVREEAARAGVMDRVKVHGRVSRSEVLAAIRGARLSVVITSVLDDSSTAVRGIVPGKLFEIIGLGSTILSIAPSGSDIESMVDAAGLGRTFSGRDVDGIAAFIERSAPVAVAHKGLERFEWRQLAGTLDEHLRTCLTNFRSEVAR